MSQADAVPDQLLNPSYFAGASILITGATGLVGSALVHSFSEADRALGLGLRLLAHGRNPLVGNALTHHDGALFLRQDITAPIQADGPVDFIFHCAGVTRSRQMAEDPVGVMDTALCGTGHVLRLAAEKKARGVIFLSSMEVYGALEDGMAGVSEEALGYLDLFSPRSAYPQAKRMCECLCNGWHAQYGVPVKTARLAQTFGKGTPAGETRVFAQFARSALAGQDIVLHTDGQMFGNYCETYDVVRALALLMERGENGQAYNVVNPACGMTIAEMAHLVAQSIGGGRVRVRVEVPPDIARMGYAAPTRNRLRADKLMSRGWRPQYDLKAMYARMVAGWKRQDTTY